jgi:hypothetical protein
VTTGVDHGWLPNDRDRSRLRGRLDRLNADATDASVATTTSNLRALLRNATSGTVAQSGGVRVRSEFVYLSEAATGASDRRAPAPEHRPPSTRLMARRGIALRLMLTALYEAQTRTAPGGRPDNHRSLANPCPGETAWTGLVATDAQDALDGKTVMTKQDKQRRHLGKALDALTRAGLVTLPFASDARNKHRQFQLRMEGGQRSGRNPIYTVPRDSDDTFIVPTRLFTRGWISVLTDAELAFVLMSAYLAGASGPDGFMVTGKTRLLHMGVGPETYEAHRTLSRFELITVTHQPSRAANGRVADMGAGRQSPIPDIVQFHPEALDEDAYARVTKVLATMTAP